MTKNSSNSSRVKGNTKLHPKKEVAKQESCKKMYCMTLNNWTEKEYSDLKLFFSSDSSNKWIIGKEIGDIEETPHLQIYVCFNKKIRFSALKKVNNRLNIHVCKGSEEANIVYCSKDGDYETFRLRVKRPLEILREDQLYMWQKSALDKIKEKPDKRSIYWFWENEGCKGKTEFCKFLAHNYGAVLIDGKKNDILYVASENDSDIYIANFSRSLEGFVSYDSIEKLKDGFYMSGKYESKSIVRNCPHIFVFANWKPEISTMSKDRWIITKIGKIEKPIPEPNSSNESEPEDGDNNGDSEIDGDYDPWSDM